MLGIVTYSGRQSYIQQHKINSSIILDYIYTAQLEITESCISAAAGHIYCINYLQTVKYQHCVYLEYMYHPYSMSSH